VRSQSASLRLASNVTLTARDAQGRIVAQHTAHNLWTTLGKEMVANLLGATTGYEVGITYCAIGTGSTAPAAGDTTLVAEASRKVISSYTPAGAVLEISTFFTSVESAYNIQEVGLFGHTSATASADSGLLFARALLALDNSGGTNNVSIDWTITCG
jgi:hypothetical protein